MTPRSNSILLVEDNPGDADLIRELLSELRNFPAEIEWVESLEAGITRLREGGIELVLLDLNLPDSSGVDTFVKLHESRLDIPVIVLSGLDDEQTAITTVQNGAQDYLQKGELSPALLDRSLRYALERHRTRRELTQSIEMIRRQNAIMGASNRLIHASLRCESEEDLGITCLQSAKDITGSEYGFIGLAATPARPSIVIMDPDTRAACSGDGKDEIALDLDSDGILSDIIRESRAHIGNGLTPDSSESRFPLGNLSVNSFMGVPLLRTDRACGLIGLANRYGGFGLDDQEAVQALSVAFVEALDRLRAEQSLRESEERFRGLSEASSDIVWELAPEGTLRYCSPKVFEVLGFNVEDVLGTSPLDLVPVEEQENIFEKTKAIAKKGDPFHGVQSVALSRTGASVLLETSGAPYFNNRGKLLGYRGITRDISDRMRSEVLQTQLDGERMIVEEMRDMERIKAEVVETVTHELRTPMTPLRSAVEMLLDGTLGDLNHRQRDMLQMMERNIQRLARFSTDVLALSRLDAGSYVIETRSIALKEVLQPVVDLLARKADQRDIKLELQPDGDMEAWADPDALGQVITNLLDNAISHNPDGTHIKVAVNPGTSGFVEINVTDDGKGIAKDSLQQLWDRFYQVDRQAGPGYRGTGLGLTVCKMLVEKMGGEITVDSVVNEGTSFLIRLPVSRQEDDQLFGRIAIEKGFVTEVQLQKAVSDWKEKKNRSRHIGAIMVDGGYITARERDDILQAQRVKVATPTSADDVPIGIVAVKAGAITKAQLAECVKAQKRLKQMGEKVPMGDIFVRMGYMDADSVAGLLAHQNNGGKKDAAAPRKGREKN